TSLTLRLVPSYFCGFPRNLHSFPTRRSSDLFPPPFRVQPRLWPFAPPPHVVTPATQSSLPVRRIFGSCFPPATDARRRLQPATRSEEHTSELQSRGHLLCRLLLKKKKLSTKT